MKLTKAINVQGLTIPAGTELHFSNEGIGYYNGQEIQKALIPEVATEAKPPKMSKKFSVEGTRFYHFSPSYVYNGQAIKDYLEKCRIKVDFDPQPWHNAACFLDGGMKAKVIFYVWDTGKIEHEMDVRMEPVFYDMTWDGTGGDRGYSKGRIPQPALSANSEVGKYAIKLETTWFEHKAKARAEKQAVLDEQLKAIDKSEIDKVIADFNKFVSDRRAQAQAEGKSDRSNFEHNLIVHAVWSVLNKFTQKHNIVADSEMVLKTLKLM
jgi:hypothetical protein